MKNLHLDHIWGRFAIRDACVSSYYLLNPYGGLLAWNNHPPARQFDPRQMREFRKKIVTTPTFDGRICPQHFCDSSQPD